MVEESDGVGSGVGSDAEAEGAIGKTVVSGMPPVDPTWEPSLGTTTGASLVPLGPEEGASSGALGGVGTTTEFVGIPPPVEPSLVDEGGRTCCDEVG
jgi:hypothetical protein